jgi:NAD(P)-dependent dehydrogenase (short-subunit alcohol dehydrogenase family)
MKFSTGFMPLRTIALTMPSVTVWPTPSGLPTASTASPTAASVMSAGVIGRKPQPAVALPDGTLHLTRVVGTDPESDIALLHSIAFAPKDDLQDGLLNCSANGFAIAMDVSCHSFVRMTKLAAPLMRDGGTMFAMTYHGANKVLPTYSVMGPLKAALETCCRYLAYELGPKGIRAHAISPGLLKTRAAYGIKDFQCC